MVSNPSSGDTQSRSLSVDLAKRVREGRREGAGGRVLAVGTHGRRSFDPRGCEEAGEAAFDARAQGQRQILGEVGRLGADRSFPAGARLGAP
jgi:hypothetical protein